MSLRLVRNLSLSAVVAAFGLAGCATPGATYVKAHPELSPVHRQIILTGRIPGGATAAGMTMEQVQAAVGSPRQREPLNGGEVWLYVHERFLDVSPRDDAGSALSSGSNTQRNFTETANLGPRPSVIEKARVFFRGNRVTQVQLTRE
jgi:outer membrane protein assembly factor BamE (lipoprotein component of BamABCDE complex)